jgi:hypothetical protein
MTSMDLYIGAFIELTPMLLLALVGTALLVRGGWMCTLLGLPFVLIEVASLYGMAHDGSSGLPLYFLASVIGTALGVMVGLPLRRRRTAKLTRAA